MRAYALVIALVAVAVVATASAARREHYRVRWTLYQTEHRVSTGLGIKVRSLRRQVRELRAQLVVRHTAAVAPPATDWVAKQIAAAEVLGREGDAAGTDPWPNCPDPYDHGGASWQDTVNCENGGDWMDSPGYYRCGLQFAPQWEARFGRLCP